MSMKPAYKIVYLLFLFPFAGYAQKIPVNAQAQTKARTELNEKGYLQFLAQNPLKTDHDQKNAQYSNDRYSNKKYKFSIQLIKGWEMIKGDEQSILIGNVERNSGRTISVGVMEFPKPLKAFAELSKEGQAEYKNILTESAKAQKRDVNIISIQNGYLGGNRALITVSHNLEQITDRKLQYYEISVSCITNGMVYTINYAVPLKSYNSADKKRFEDFTRNFKFE